MKTAIVIILILVGAVATYERYYTAKHYVSYQVCKHSFQKPTKENPFYEKQYLETVICEDQQRFEDPDHIDVK